MHEGVEFRIFGFSTSYWEDQRWYL